VNADRYFAHEYEREREDRRDHRRLAPSPLMSIALTRSTSFLDENSQNRYLYFAIRQFRDRASGLGIAIALSRERSLSIECARSRLATLHEAIGHAYGRIRDIETDSSALERDQDRKCARRLSRATDHACALDRAVIVCRALGYAPASCRKRNAELIRALEWARRCAPDDLVHDRERTPAVYIDAALAIAHGIRYDLIAADRTRPPGAMRRERVMAQDVSPLAQRLAFMAAGLLPSAVRGRYLEEYCCELREITNGGGGLAGQLAYVSRLLIGSLPMRAALLSPRRKKALP
jgi:hypothetical protein